MYQGKLFNILTERNQLVTPSFFFLMAVLTASDWGNLSKLSYQWFTWGLISPFTVNFWKLVLLIGVYVFNLVVMENFGVVSLQSPQYHHWCAWNCVICRWGINMQITPHGFKEQTVITKHSNVFTWKYNTFIGHCYNEKIRQITFCHVCWSNLESWARTLLD